MYYCMFYIMLPVSLPRLVNFDWRVDVKTSSDSAARMAQPTCIVQMKVSLSLLLECLINAQVAVEVGWG